MAEKLGQVQIEKLALSTDTLDSPLLAAFREYETVDLQFGFEWLANLAATALDEDEKAVIYIARHSSSDFIACPMKVNSRKGSAESLSTFYSTSYSPIVASTTPEILLVALFQHFAGKERFSSLTFSPMDNSAPEFELVNRALSQSGWSGIHQFFCFGNWIHDFREQSIQTYMAARPSRLKNTIARRTRQFLSDNRGHLELVTGGDQLERSIESFVTIYNASWKKAEPYPDFIPQLLRMAAARGWLRLGIASYDNRPVASQIWLVCGGKASIFKLAYHQDYGQYSPGTILTAFLMEHVVDKDAVSSIDYLSGDDRYKQDWMSVRRERYGIAAYNPRTVRGCLMLIARTLKEGSKLLRRKGA